MCFVAKQLIIKLCVNAGNQPIHIGALSNIWMIVLHFVMYPKLNKNDLNKYGCVKKACAYLLGG